MLQQGMILRVALITTAFSCGGRILADTTSWDVHSLEWLVDTSDAIFVAEVLGSEDADKWGIKQRHRLKVSEMIKTDRDAPKDEVALENWTQYDPGDVLVIFWDERFAKQKIRSSDKRRIINTSKHVEFIHYDGPQKRKLREYSFLAMDAVGEVIETREELVRRVKQRMKENVEPISAEKARRAEGAYPFNKTATAGYRRHDPEYYESYGYDVVITLLIPLDQATLERMREKGQDYTSTPSSYLGAQAISKIVKLGKLEDLQPAKRASEAESLQDVMAWTRRSPRAMATLASHTKPAITSAGPASLTYTLPPSGKILFQSGTHGLTANDVATGQQLFQLDVYLEVHSLRFGPAERYMTWYRDGSVTVVDTEAGEVLFNAKTKWVTGLCFSGDGQRLAYLGNQGKGEYCVAVHDLRKKDIIARRRFVGIKGRLDLEDVGERGDFAILRASNLGKDRLMVVSIRDEATDVRWLDGMEYAAIVARDRAVAMLAGPSETRPGEPAAKGIETPATANGEADALPGEQQKLSRELVVRSLIDDALLLQATLPPSYVTIKPFGEDLIAICKAPTLDGGRALLFSIRSDRVRGQVLQWLRR